MLYMHQLHCAIWAAAHSQTEEGMHTLSDLNTLMLKHLFCACELITCTVCQLIGSDYTLPMPIAMDMTNARDHLVWKTELTDSGAFVMEQTRLLPLQ